MARAGADAEREDPRVARMLLTSASTASVFVTSPSVSTTIWRARLPRRLLEHASSVPAGSRCRRDRRSASFTCALPRRGCARHSCGSAGTTARAVEPKPTMLNVQPAIIDRRQSCSAFRTSAIDVPSIDPERSTRNVTSHGDCRLTEFGRKLRPRRPGSRLSSRSSQACGVSRPSHSTDRMKSRSSACPAVRA